MAKTKWYRHRYPDGTVSYEALNVGAPGCRVSVGPAHMFEWGVGAIKALKYAYTAQCPGRAGIIKGKTRTVRSAKTAALTAARKMARRKK